MTAYVPRVPRRARVRLDALRRDAAPAARMRREVGALPGTHKVQVKRHAASVIVHDCPVRGEIACIIAQISTRCPRGTANRDRAPGTAWPVAPPRGIGLPRRGPHVRSAMGVAVGTALVATLGRPGDGAGLSRLLPGPR